MRLQVIATAACSLSSNKDHVDIMSIGNNLPMHIELVLES
jgi:hypothetical protein